VKLKEELIEPTWNGQSTIGVLLGLECLRVNTVQIRHLEGVLIEGLDFDKLAVQLVEQVVVLNLESRVLREHGANFDWVRIDQEIHIL
jgi:hypothetical protein